jgi:hypothetical protein
MKQNEPDAQAVHCYVSEKDNALYVRDEFKDAAALGFHLSSTAAGHFPQLLASDLHNEENGQHSQDHVPASSKEPIQIGRVPCEHDRFSVVSESVTRSQPPRAFPIACATTPAVAHDQQYKRSFHRLVPHSTRRAAL